MSSLAAVVDLPSREGLASRLVQLFAGLLLYGVGVSLLVLSGHGLEPWNVLHQGLARHSDIAIGTWSIIVSGAVLLLWIPLHQRPGVGTVANAIGIGLVMDIVLGTFSEPHGQVARWACMVLGILSIGVATGAYIGAGLGPGPRDGLMLGLARRTGGSLRLVRTALEATVLLAGWLLGGTVGIGTLLFLVTIGPLVHFFVPLLDRRPAAGREPD